jgi:hypothetical protein
MARNLTNSERETSIIFNEADRTASVFTYNGALQRKLLKLCEERSDDAKHNRTNEFGGMEFTVPKKWIKINASLILSDEQKQARSERAKANMAKLHERG